MGCIDRPNIKDRWFHPSNDLPNTERNVLVKCKILPDVCIGIYHPDTGDWGIYVDGVERFDCEVTYWRDIPLPPEVPYPYNFRSAAEARYLTRLAQIDSFDKNTAQDFYNIRIKIIIATMRGEYICYVKKSEITEDLKSNLKSVGYSVYESDEDPTTIYISWEV